MNASPLPASAMLALLCLLPRASALTVTQTFNSAFSGQASGYGPITRGATWNFAPFDMRLGTLQSVSFAVTANATVTMYDMNGWATPTGPVGPMAFTPWVQMHLNAGNTDGGGGQSTVDSTGQTVVLQFEEGITFSANLSATTTSIITDGDSLNRFAGIGTWPEGVTPHRAVSSVGFWSSSRFGETRSDGTTTATLTYHYEVPDGGSSFTLAVITGLLLIGVHRRSIRNLPVE